MPQPEPPLQEGHRSRLAWLRDASMRYHVLIVLAALFVCAYAAGVIGHVLTMPDIGVRCAFSTVVNQFEKEFRFPSDQPETLKVQDRVLRVGDQPIHDWPQLLRTLRSLRDYEPEAI